MTTTAATVSAVGEEPTVPAIPVAVATARGSAPRTPRLPIAPLLAAVIILLGFLIVQLTRSSEIANALWLAGLVVCGAPVVWQTARGALKGHFAADIVASLAIVGAIAFLQPLAGLIVVVMQTGGEALERYAQGRASNALHDLEMAAPRTAHIVRTTGIADVDAATVVVGDHLLVRPGELVPCDGVVIEGRSHVDTSQLTGEAVPRTVIPGSFVMSGIVNLEGAVTLRATAVAAASQYARIVELVRSAQASKAPLQRLADRYAVWFTPLVIVLCIATYVITSDPTRVLAVLMVATPCPLILAAPVAFIGGINSAARRGIVIRTGSALEQLAGASALVLDKTGTVTEGIPAVAAVVPVGDKDERESLRLAAGVEARSGHLLARAVVRAADLAGLSAKSASNVLESPGAGVSGVVEGRNVAIGALSYILATHPAAAARFITFRAPGLRAYVVIDGEAAAVIEFADKPRAGIQRFIADLRSAGIKRVLLLSGDSVAHTMAIAKTLEIQEAHGDLLPGDKVAIVKSLTRVGERVIMLGDGTNDAPALGTAHVGVALAGHGGGITAEAADVVLLADDPRGLLHAIGIARRTMRIARQSITAGLALSSIGMAVAAVGYLTPIAGAISQELIDVAVILNALRSSGSGRASHHTEPL